MSTLKYILRHGWLWPLEFWLRPFAVQKRITTDRKKEFWSTFTGSTFTGLLAGFTLWLTGNIPFNNIWIIAVAVVSINIFAVAGVIGGDVAIAAVVAITGTLAGFLAVFFPVDMDFALALAASGALAVASIGAFVGNNVFADTEPSTNLAGISAMIFCIFGIGLGGLLEKTWSSWILFFSSIILLISFVSDLLKKEEELTDATGLLLIITLFILFPAFIARVLFDDLATEQQIKLLGIVLISAIMLGIISGKNYSFKSSPLSKVVNSFVIQRYIMIISQAVTLWFYISIQGDLKSLAAYLFITLLFCNNFALYPLLLPLSYWLYQPIRVQQHSLSTATPLISYWQSLSLPLPRLKQYLTLVVEKDVKLGYATLRTVQTQSYQGIAARKAAQLVLRGREGLSFTSYLAVNTNPATLYQLLLGPPIARSVAVLPATDKEKIKEKYVQLYIYKLLRVEKEGIFPLFLSGKHYRIDLVQLNEQPIAKRLAAARSFLAQSQECTGKEEYSTFLKILKELSAPEDFRQLSQCQPHELIPEDTSWLQGGWQIVTCLQKHRSGILQAYQSLSNIEAKKTYLHKQQERLKAIDWTELPWFWAGIAEELVEIWVALYEQEIKETREWLLLEITPETNALRPGNTTLNLCIDNKSGAIAQQIQLHVNEQENLSWFSKKLSLPGLLQGQGSNEIRLDLLIEQPGRYIINGTLTALDLDERSYEWPVNFVLHADEKGKPYQLAEKQYYIVGPRLSSDFLFVGRKHLLHDIELLWQKPENKEALLLIGLRRMGKSSLLEKIHRDGINDQIIPLLIDLQGKASQHAFLQTVAEAMAAELHCTAPVLEQNNPGPAFEQFLRSLTPQLAGRYFLLMIDEANFFARRNYGELPHLLRSLMQAPDVPLLLLFCGTYELRQGAGIMTPSSIIPPAPRTFPTSIQLNPPRCSPARCMISWNTIPRPCNWPFS